MFFDVVSINQSTVKYVCMCGTLLNTTVVTFPPKGTRGKPTKIVRDVHRGFSVGMVKISFLNTAFMVYVCFTLTELKQTVCWRVYVCSPA